MKKILSFSMLCLLVAAFAAGCGSSDGKQEPTGSNPSPTAEVSSTETADLTEAPTQAVETETKELEAAETETVLEESGFGFGDLKGYEFYFSSGVGGWYTSMTIDEDGSFSGIYTDSDMGDREDAYPQGTVYRCDFSGTFAPLEKVDEYTCKTSVESISYDRKAGEEEIQNETRFVYSDAYGI